MAQFDTNLILGDEFSRGAPRTWVDWSAAGLRDAADARERRATT